MHMGTWENVAERIIKNGRYDIIDEILGTYDSTEEPEVIKELLCNALQSMPYKQSAKYRNL